PRRPSPASASVHASLRDVGTLHRIGKCSDRRRAEDWNASSSFGLQAVDRGKSGRLLRQRSAPSVAEQEEAEGEAGYYGGTECRGRISESDHSSSRVGGVLSGPACCTQAGFGTRQRGAGSASGVPPWGHKNLNNSK